MSEDQNAATLDRSSLCFVTLTVPDLGRAERFYVDELGFTVTRRYEPTRWLSLSVDEENGPGLGLMEEPAAVRSPSSDRVDFWVQDLATFVKNLSSDVEVIHPPQEMPWGSFKAEIRDCFGRRLGLVQRA